MTQIECIPSRMQSRVLLSMQGDSPPINKAFPLSSSTRSCIARLSSLIGQSSKQDASQDGASANYCASLALVASVISKDRCCPILVFSLIPTASTQPLLIFCAVIAPFLPTFVMDSYCAWHEGCPRWKILNRITLIVQRVTVFTQIVRAFHTTITADSWIIEIRGALAAAPVSHPEVL